MAIANANFSFLTNRFVPIIENNGSSMPYTVETLINTVLALGKAGIMEIEMADRDKNALHVFQAVQLALDAADISDKNNIPVIGPGTISDVDKANAYIDAGAQFIVGAFFVSSVADVCHKKNIPYIPGVHTPAEAYEAISHSSVFALKIFPAHTPRHVKALKLIFPNVLMIASWGPTMETIQEWVSPGHADAVVFGGDLVNIGLYDQDFQQLKSVTRVLIKSAQDIRK